MPPRSAEKPETMLIEAFRFDEEYLAGLGNMLSNRPANVIILNFEFEGRDFMKKIMAFLAFSIFPPSFEPHPLLSKKKMLLLGFLHQEVLVVVWVKVNALVFVDALFSVPFVHGWYELLHHGCVLRGSLDGGEVGDGDLAAV